ncbi:hypothetical protein BH10PSE12_BH10PSE12_11870 [soil metagenome]
MPAIETRTRQVQACATPVGLSGMTAGIAIAALMLLAGCKAGESAKEPTQREQIGQVWKYETEKSVPLAYIGSANSVKTLSAPDTFAVILLQKMKSGETGVTIKAVGAPFTCDLSACAVEASADGGPVLTWKGRMTETKDGIAIPPPQNAFEAISGAKQVKVILTLGSEGAHPFTFNTSGLDWAK